MRNPFQLNASLNDAHLALREFNLTTLTVNDEKYKVADPTMLIPECMQVIQKVEKILDEICETFNLVTPNQNMFGTSFDIPMNDSINQWLDKIREELSKQYGTAMLDSETWAMSHGIDIEGIA